MKICIDPGHGGSDPGAVGPTDLQEDDVNLAVSDYLSKIMEDLGVSTKLTRTTNTSISLDDRCSVANTWQANYFVSIHCNSNGSSAVGIETLYKTSNGKELAVPIQSALIESTGDTDRGLKQRNDLYVLNGTNMPAILVEIGFISHPQTEAKLRTGDYQKQIASAIAAGLAEFLNIAPSKQSPPMT